MFWLLHAKSLPDHSPEVKDTDVVLANKAQKRSDDSRDRKDQSKELTETREPELKSSGNDSTHLDALSKDFTDHTNHLRL